LSTSNLTSLSISIAPIGLTLQSGREPPESIYFAATSPFSLMRLEGRQGRTVFLKEKFIGRKRWFLKK
jgi:hypothetical protein